MSGRGDVRVMKRILFVLAAVFLLATPSFAAQCGGDFNAFIAAMGREAQAAGVSREVIGQALAGITPDPNVLAFDRRQKGMFHAKSFEEYSATRVVPARIKRGGTTRVAEYSSKLLAWNMPFWRRSKASTLGSGVMPAKAWPMTSRDTPAACASRPIAAMKALKSPPHWAAKEGVARRKTAARTKRMRFMTRTSPRPLIPAQAGI